MDKRMTFTNDKAIYIQMADRLCDEIAGNSWNSSCLKCSEI